ncbi:transglycosylase SLT domain-containing protein [Pseudomonas sp. 210_17 TE3656]
MKKFKELVVIFEKHADKYGFDHLMLMAQGFQESQLDQAARSHRGAVGVMQLLPTTAADPTVGIEGIDKSADRNIEAGTKYMRLLADKYLNDPALSPTDKTLMTFAAYNAGPGNLRKFRALAQKSGLNQNIWFENVEYATAQIVGRETVDYVGNIYKYYVAYKLVEEKNKAAASKAAP